MDDCIPFRAASESNLPSAPGSHFENRLAPKAAAPEINRSKNEDSRGWSINECLCNEHDSQIYEARKQTAVSLEPPSRAIRFA